MLSRMHGEMVLQFIHVSNESNPWTRVDLHCDSDRWETSCLFVLLSNGRIRTPFLLLPGQLSPDYQ